MCVVLLTALLLGYGTPAAAQSDEDPITRVETTLNTMAEEGTLSGSVLVARDGDVLLSEGYGLANREWDVPNTPDTKFQIASMTKQFTAMAILILQERGLLTVQDHVCQYLDECPEAWQDITIEHLLTHTSGIRGNYYDMQGFEPTQLTSPSHLIRLFIDGPLSFPPGAAWSYSDSGYIVLGRIIEVVSDQPYRRFLRENIFDPLGMVDTDYDLGTSVIEHRAEGYIDPTHRANYFHISNGYAAFGLYSTVEDLYLWEEAVFGGRVVSQESWDAVLAAAIPVPEMGEGLSYSYGLWMGSLDEHPFIAHGGIMDGFRSGIARYTDDNLTVIFLGNLQTLNGWLVLETIAGIMFDEA